MALTLYLLHAEERKTTMSLIRTALFTVILLTGMTTNVHAEILKPFILGNPADGSMEEVVNAVQTALSAQ